MPSVDNTITQTKKVEGVLIKNNEIRNNLLMMNRGKYSMYKENLSPAIGEYYELRDFKAPASITGGKSLSEYTYNKKESYGKTIVDKNGIINWEKQQYDVDDTRQVNTYNSGSNNYLNYIDSVYGDNTAWLRSIENMLSIISPENALKKIKVGIVDNPRVMNALNGVITTNPNYRDSNAVVDIAEAIYQGSFDPIKNLSLNDTDTVLGIITNTMYANSLYSAARFNTARGRDNIKKHPYITPSLFNVYGNNLSTITKLSDIFWVDQDTGRNRDNFSGRILELKDVNSSGLGYADHILGQFEEAARAMDDEFGGAVRTKRYNPLFGQNADNDNGYLDDYTKEMSPSELSLTQRNSSNETYAVNTRRSQHYMYTEPSSHPAGFEYYGTSGRDDESDYTEFDDTEFDDYFRIDNITNISSEASLIRKTNEMFKSGKINTMIARFTDSRETTPSTIDTAVSKEAGKSHGRALLKAKNKYLTSHNNGYWNPYCRTWTFHHQYDRYNRTIRPFCDDCSGDGNKYNILGLQNLIKENSYRASGFADENLNGPNYLASNTVLRDAGFVRITPDREDKTAVDRNKRYMFSIENLAWKDFYGDVEYLRKGPNGGRIMWFPPYDLEFQENVSVDWNANAFIGRGEKVYTYSNTDRTAQLGFTILIDHPSIINKLENYEGKNGDPDGDILRFFAGCDVFDGLDKKPEEKKAEDKKNVPKENVEVPQQGEDIIFYVFFPNNYSGIDQFNMEPQSDWADYLVYGWNGNFKTGSDGKEVGNGYEMKISSDEGITDVNNPLWRISSCEKNNFSCLNCKPIDNKTFGYRVDCNRRAEKYENQDNYNDTNSIGLNGNLEIVKALPFATKPTHTFAQIYAALNWQDDKKRSEVLSRMNQEEGYPDVISELMETLKNVKSIEVRGGASRQHKETSEELAKGRAKTVANWLKQALDVGNENVNDANTIKYSQNTEKEKDNSVRKVKAQKCALVRLSFNNPNKSNAGNQSDEMFVDEHINETVIPNVKSTGQAIKDKRFEYEYFKQLEENDPVVFKMIKQKYQYFDPAFHSISPEGFSARLNFLHQCTRQGHTVSASEVAENKSAKMAATAGNLSFGRMPVCVLRIGDFINSRMIIQSMSISYSTDGITWDLNPEGAGVQPMFAKVSMGVVLIGGSALNMPVNRLQNANTFDYYANSGVYEYRADRPEYIGGDYKNGVQYHKIYTPNLDTVESKKEDNQENK